MATRRATKGKKRGGGAGRRTSAGRHPDLAIFDGLCREVLVTQGRDVIREGDPLQAELWASSLLGMFGASPLIGEPDARAAIGGRLVHVAQKVRRPESLLCMRALAAVADGPLRGRAAGAARALGTERAQAPTWVDAIGTARATEAWRASDRFGDQDSVMVGFAYPDGTEHSVLVLVDHVLGGIAKDVAVLGPLAAVLPFWRDGDPAIELVSEPVEVAAGRVMAAMAQTSCDAGAPVTDDYRDSTALVRARLAPLAAPATDTAPARTVADREALVKAFLASPSGSFYGHDPDAWFLLDSLVDYRCDRQGGDPLRWSPSVAEGYLLDDVPRALSAGEQTLRRAPQILRAWAAWSAGRAALPPSVAQETLALVDDVEDEFLDAVADEKRWGPAKRLAMQMLDAGVDVTDVEAANRWLAGHTARARG